MTRPSRRSDPEHQVQDPGRGDRGGADPPRGRADHPDGAPRRLLGVPDGDAAPHGALLLRRGAGARRLRVRRLHRARATEVRQSLSASGVSFCVVFDSTRPSLIELNSGPKQVIGRPKLCLPTLGNVL